MDEKEVIVYSISNSNGSAVKLVVGGAILLDSVSEEGLKSKEGSISVSVSFLILFLFKMKYIRNPSLTIRQKHKIPIAINKGVVISFFVIGCSGIIGDVENKSLI